MRLQTSPALSSVVAGATIPLDREANPFAATLVIEVLSGTNTSKVQYTVDNVWDSTVTPLWLDHATLTGISATTSGTLTFPVTAVRLNMTAFTSGSAQLVILQSKPGA